MSDKGTRLELLERLAKLHEMGDLTDAEFASEKANLLQSSAENIDANPHISENLEPPDDLRSSANAKTYIALGGILLIGAIAIFAYQRTSDPTWSEVLNGFNGGVALCFDYQESGQGFTCSEIQTWSGEESQPVYGQARMLGSALTYQYASELLSEECFTYDQYMDLIRGIRSDGQGGLFSEVLISASLQIGVALTIQEVAPSADQVCNELSNVSWLTRGESRYAIGTATTYAKTGERRVDLETNSVVIGGDDNRFALVSIM